MTPQGKKLFAELQKLAELEVKVGFTADKAGQGKNHESVDAADYEDGTTIAHVAAWNEFGTEHIPERPFMRQTVEKHGDDVFKAAKTLMGQVVKGEITADKAIRSVGAIQVGLIQHEIKAGGFAENAPSTKKQKGGSEEAKTTPLIDDGRLRQSVHYVVKPRKG